MENCGTELAGMAALTVAEKEEKKRNQVGEASEERQALPYDECWNVLSSLCQAHMCRPSELNYKTLSSLEMVAHLQAENAQLRKKLLQKGQTNSDEARNNMMEGELGFGSHEAEPTPSCNNIYENFQSVRDWSPLNQEKTPSTINGSQGQWERPELETKNFTNPTAPKPDMESLTIKQFFRALAMPEVKPSGNRRGQKFDEFLRSFHLKFPKETYTNEDRREVFVSYLEGEAKLHYSILSPRIKNGTLDEVVRALKSGSRLETQEERAHALRKLRSLIKRENQSEDAFCLELEILSSKAHPECDEDTLGLIRAEILQDQLQDWPEAYHTAEILETHQGHEVKPAGITKSSHRLQPQVGGDEQYPKIAENNDKGGAKVKQDESKPLPDIRNKQVKCTNCGKRGHQSNDCWSKKPGQQNNCSFSTVVEAWSCKSSTTERKVNGLVGPKHIVKVKCLNTIIPAMIDTGSQLTIMPLSVLLKAKESGVDMDDMCQQLPKEDLNVLDASGDKMDFLGCMETEIELIGGLKAKIQMHVKKLKDSILLLGTNALKSLGVDILINKRPITEPITPAMISWEQNHTSETSTAEPAIPEMRSQGQIRPLQASTSKPEIPKMTSHGEIRSFETSTPEQNTKIKYCVQRSPSMQFCGR
ncbi:zinc knuckle [Ancylostoma caninum]|uniref:Zinc knuckle n=1 Tax=Ancylostoma caninum TaxID=29170 RepID=A0A368H287_ANCCA|nr:zinc knuckle [Ancylostoma caninum]